MSVDGFEWMDGAKNVNARTEKDVSASSNSNADDCYERGSLMDGRTRDENDTGWIGP